MGTVLFGLCLNISAQTTPLETPEKIDYPGILQTFEKLIQIDSEKIKKRSEILLKNGKVFSDAKNVSSLELEPDFLNSIILHSDPGYIKLASNSKCRFYETILTDLLKSSEGKIQNVLMTYIEKEMRHSALISKKDFLNKVVSEECPETSKTIAAFQIKTLDETLKGINFDIPSGVDQCQNIHLNWLNNPKTPFLCQIHEYIQEAQNGLGSDKSALQRKAVAKILENKLSGNQKDYIANLCTHLDNEEIFCEEFLNVSFWNKIANGSESSLYAQDICKKTVGTSDLSNSQLQSCLGRLKKERDLCLYPDGRNSGLKPQPDCDQLSTALNFSSLKVNYKDCPGNSDQMMMTNMGRIISHFTPQNMTSDHGPCSGYSAGVTYQFNKMYDNDLNWKIEACYEDKINDKEVCTKTYFGQFGNQPESYPIVVANILKNTKKIDSSLTCEMVDTADYNPLLLKYKSGCYILYDRDSCFISQCKHKILLNDQQITYIKVKGHAELAYFPQSIREERFSQHYLLTNDFKKTGKRLENLSLVTDFFKKSKNGIIHGVGCAEDLLPTFFKSYSMNQCTPLPFIINGILKDSEKNKVVLVTRTAADSIGAPRLLSWSTIYSGVKSYQKVQPLKQWTMYGLD